MSRISVPAVSRAPVPARAARAGGEGSLHLRCFLKALQKFSVETKTPFGFHDRGALSDKRLVPGWFTTLRDYLIGPAGSRRDVREPQAPIASRGNKHNQLARAIGIKQCAQALMSLGQFAATMLVACGSKTKPPAMVSAGE